MIKKYLIIGSSAGGIGSALRLRMLDIEADITIVTAEDSLPYNKCLLADVLLGERDSDSTVFCSHMMLAEKKITFIAGTVISTLDNSKKYVSSTDGRNFTYDALCIATGRSPRMIPVFTDKEYTNLFNFYYKKNVDQIIKYVGAYKPRYAIVIGAGLTGLEAADGLRAQGCQVTLIESAQQLLPHLVNKRGAQVIDEQMRTMAVQVLTNEIITGYTAIDGRITSIKTKNNGEIFTDLVVCAVGATPNTDFLPPIAKNVDGYCIVDSTLCTTLSDVYAVGDCCIVYDRLYKGARPSALWPDAMQQGMYAAYNMTGIEKIYPGTVSIAASGFFGIKIASAGPIHASGENTYTEACGQGWYHQFIYEKNQLMGFILVGNTGELATYRRQIMMIS